MHDGTDKRSGIVSPQTVAGALAVLGLGSGVGGFQINSGTIEEQRLYIEQLEKAQAAMQESNVRTVQVADRHISMLQKRLDKVEARATEHYEDLIVCLSGEVGGAPIDPKDIGAGFTLPTEFGSGESSSE
jgi:hypothetical protein